MPPAYHFHDTPTESSRLPICGIVCAGSSTAGLVSDGACRKIERVVLTAKPSGVTEPSVMTLPLASSTALAVAGAVGNTGEQAQTSQKWLRNEPPKAAWKKLSASVYCCAICQVKVEEISQKPIDRPAASDTAANLSILPPSICCCS